MPIPLYISPNTPLPGPADFTTPIMAAFQARNRRKETEQQAQLERERMSAQQQESQADRQQRGQHQKETSEYNRGMLDLYKGDRSEQKRSKQEEAEDKAWAEYLAAEQDAARDPGRLIRAKQRLQALGRKAPPDGGSPAAPASAPQGSFRSVPLDLGGPLPLRGLY